MQTLRSKQGTGAISLVVLMTLIAVMAGTASIATAQLRFANQTTAAVKQERSTDVISDASAWLESLEGSLVLDGSATRVVLLQDAPVARCVVIELDNGVVTTKQRRIAPGETPMTECTHEAKNAPFGSVRGAGFVYHSEDGDAIEPQVARSVSIVLSDTRGAADELVVISTI